MGGVPESPFPHTLSYVTVHLVIFYYIQCNKPINVSVSHSNKFLNLRRGLWEPSFIPSWSEVQVIDNLGLVIGF